jgi:hypothetical protein
MNTVIESERSRFIISSFSSNLRVRWFEPLPNSGQRRARRKWEDRTLVAEKGRSRPEASSAQRTPSIGRLMKRILLS